MKAVLPLALAISSASVLANNPKNTKDDATLEQVVVYGSKQDKSLSSLTTSVQVLGEEALETQAIQDFNDVFARVANVASLRDGNETVFSVRGISVYGAGDNLRAYTSSVYVDDVPLNIGSIRYGGFDIWDVQQVEVHRGPQGTLQGRNSLAGAIHIKTQDPTYDTNGKIRVQAGSYGMTRFSVAGGTGIIDDVLAVRFAIDDYRNDSYIENVTRNEDDYAGAERTSYRAKVLFEPTDSFSALLTLNHTENDTNSSPSAISSDPFSLKAYSDREDFNNLESDLASLKLEYAISDEITLSSITSVSKDKVHRFDDWDSSNYDGGFIDQFTKAKTSAQEFRVNFDNDRFNGVAGLYVSKEKQDLGWVTDGLFVKDDVEGIAFNMLEAMQIPLQQAQLIWSVVPRFIDINGKNQGNFETENYALFGEVNFEPSENVIVTLGLRYDREKQDYKQFVDNNVNSGPLPFPSPLVTGAAQQLMNALAQENLAVREKTYTAILPKAAVQLLLSEDNSVAFSVQKGYRAGGTSSSQLDGKTKPYDPETTLNYEIAFRNTLNDGDTQLNANIFYTDWTDMQVDVSPSGDPRDKYTDNAGKAELYGAEIEFTTQLTDALELFSSLGYVKTEFKSFKVTEGFNLLGDYTGNEFADAPNFTGNIGILFDRGQGIYAQADATAQNAAYTHNSNSRKNDSRFLINGRVGYKVSNIDVSLWVKNLMDREYITRQFEVKTYDGALPVPDYTHVGAPRTVGISLGYEF